MAGDGGGSNPADTAVGGIRQRPPERNADIVRGEGGEGIWRATVGVEENPGRMGRLREEKIQQRRPSPSSVEGNGTTEGDGQLPLDAEGRPLFLSHPAGEGSIQPGFADACAGMGKDKVPESPGPSGGGSGCMPGMEAERDADRSPPRERSPFEGGRGHPVGLGGGIHVDMGNIRFTGPPEHGVKMRREARILEMAMGVGVGHVGCRELYQGPCRAEARNAPPRIPGQFFDFNTAMKASWGMPTLPNCFMRFLPSFCFSRSLRLRVMSPP